jgi:lysine 2,3-aminomutase
MNSITNKKLEQFLSETVPEFLVPSADPKFAHIITKADFIEDALKALEIAPMNIRITPYILSRIDWHQALDNPLRRQFLPLKSCLIEDHPKLTLDSLGEEADSREYVRYRPRISC